MLTYSPTSLHTPPAARITVPGSKSHTNRALLISALAAGRTRLEHALFSDDSRYFAEALRELGFDIRLDEASKTMSVSGLCGRIPNEQADLFIGNAGTAARFLTALLAIGYGTYTLDGVERMRERPIGDLVIALNQLGANIRGQSPVDRDARALSPPISVDANGLLGGQTTVRGDISSQFLSGLLMVAPYAQNKIEITVEGPLHSRPYIDLTLGVMADFGVNVQREDYSKFSVTPQSYLSPGKYPIESDASAASYFFAVPAICGGWVEVANLSRRARQGDIAFLQVLEKMGCTVEEMSQTVRVTRSFNGPALQGVDVNMSDISDTAMTLAVIAPFADRPTTIRGIASSRVKETDRIAATVTELRRLGVQVEEFSDGMTITPCKQIHPAQIDTYDDHRMAMAFSLIGLRVPGVEIENPGCVAKTFPDFFTVLEQLSR